MHVFSSSLTKVFLMNTNEESEKYLEGIEASDFIQDRNKPNLLPPQPFLNLGIYTRLAYERFIARTDI